MNLRRLEDYHICILDYKDILKRKTSYSELKKYIPNGTKAKAGQKCEECNSNNLIYQEGCLICTDCGHSKCG